MARTKQSGVSPVLHSAGLSFGSTRSVPTMKLGPLLAAAIAICGLPLALSAQKPPMQPRPVTVDDQFEIREVQGPQLSPDAQWVAYTVETLSLQEDKTGDRI